MAALVGKKERYTQMLYQLLKDKGELSVAQIQELLGISRKSVYNYIEELEARNVQLQTRAQGKTKLYSLVEEAVELGQYGAIDKNVMIVSSIVRALQKQPMTEKELIKAWGMDIRQDDGSFAENDYVGIKATQLHNLLATLTEARVLQWDGKNNPYYPTGKLVPPLLKLQLDVDSFYELKDKLESITTGHPYYKQLHTVYEKMNFICDDEEYENDEVFLVQGKSYFRFQEVKPLVQRLIDANFANKIISFELTDKQGKVTKKTFAVGMLVYAADKDKLYMFGRNANADGKIKGSATPIDVSKIDNVQEKEGANTIFGSQEYQDIYKEMLSVSIEPAEEVEVEFEHKFNNLAKLEQLKRQRPLAKLVVKGDTIIYKDRVRGLADFANYLRTFGKRFRVVKPLKLRKIILNGIMRNLKLYEELENGQLL